MLFFGVFASNYALLGGVKLQKMLSTGNYATLWSFPAFTAVLCSTHVCTAVCLLFAVCDKWVDFRGGDAVQQCVVCVFFPFWTSSSLDVPAGVTQEESHTGFFIHLLSAVRALMFPSRRIQPFLSLVDREVEFCVLTI